MICVCYGMLWYDVSDDIVLVRDNLKEVMVGWMSGG